MVRRQRGRKGPASRSRRSMPACPDQAQPGRSCPAAIIIAPTPTMSRASRNAPSSARERRKRPGRLESTGVAPAEMYEKLYGMCKRRDEGPHLVRRAVTSWACPGSPLQQGRRGDHRLDLRRAQHAHHDAHGPGRVGPTRRQDGKFTKGLHSMLDINPERRLHRAFPTGQHDHLGRLQLRRQRAAWARSASRCALVPTSAVSNTGWQNTC